MATSELVLVVPADGLLRLPTFAGQRVTVTAAKAKRSLAQNRTLYGPVYNQALSALMEACGYDAHEVHDKHCRKQAHYGLLAQCFGETVDKITGKSVPNKTSSELNTAQFSEFLQWLQRYAAPYGIVIELPDERGMVR